ncbi:MAG: CotH kinase family protein, partial [Planctomycetota bacterium]
GEFAVVAKDRAAFCEQWGDHPRLFGGYDGSIDNGGERIGLRDALDAAIDTVDFDDRAPWPAFADGDGSSLQRICVDAEGWRPENWLGSPAEVPTPFAATERGACPLPDAPMPPVVINEIHYHPADDRDADEEYVELYNRSDEAVNLRGWRFSAGFTYEFGTESDVMLGAGEYLVVCRNPDAIRANFGVENVVGPFVSGGLSNIGERVAISDSTGAVIDSVRYSDQGEWTYAADGLAYSLERYSPDSPGYDPANWTHGSLQAKGFLRLSVTGAISGAITQRFICGINGVGEAIIDNVSLQQVGGNGDNLIVDGDFELGGAEWTPRGNAQESRVEQGIGVDGSRGMRIVSSDGCTETCGSIDSVAYQFPRRFLDDEFEYRLTIDFQLVSGSTQIYARMLGGVEVAFEALNLTPGRANTESREAARPLVTDLGRFPREPRSRDEVTLSARVRASNPLSSVVLTYFRADQEIREDTTVPMFDDGMAPDAFAGDGVFTCAVPPQSHNAQVHFTITAETESGDRLEFPRPVDVDGRLPQEVWGYYVNDDQPESSLPVYHLLVPGANPEASLRDQDHVNEILNCSTLRAGGLAYRGEIFPAIGLRWRGNTACWIQKRNFKLKFQRGRDFKGVRKVNLQGVWTDKALVREHVSWQFMNEIGIPAVETEFIRVHMNGQYHGLFLQLEHPDQRWLRRFPGLDSNGCLYKARQPPSNGGQPRGVVRLGRIDEYSLFWEKETCESEDLTGLAEFVDDLHSQNVQSVEFVNRRIPEDWTIGYQIAQVALNNIDSFAKNHFLYGEPEQVQWAMIGWDMDLTFGKYFNPGAVDSFPNGQRPVGTLNDCMLSDFGGDLNPWFTTRVNGNSLLHHYVDKFMLAGQGHFQRAYLVRLYRVLEEKMNLEHFGPILDDLVDRLEEEADDDLQKWGRYRSNPGCPAPDSMAENVAIMKDQIRKHELFLRRYIRQFHVEVERTPQLKFTEIMYDPAGVEETLEFVE